MFTKEKVIRGIALTLFAISVALAVLFVRPAWSQSTGTDVPLSARDEINRRGNMVQITGDIRADDTDLIAEAFAVPIDDSHKWYVSIITTTPCPPCERLKAHFMNDPELQKWVNLADPAKSWAHYQVYNWDNQQLRPKFDGLKLLPNSPIHSDGTIDSPVIIVQPPRNGDFGKPTNIVVMRCGYDGDSKKLSDFMRTSVARYVVSQRNDSVRKYNPVQVNNYKQEAKQQLGNELEAEPAVSGGIAQPVASMPIGDSRTPPYKLAPRGDDFMPQGGPFEIPAAPPRPRYLGISDVRSIIPDAPTDYLLDAVDKQYTDPDKVVYDWMKEKNKRDKADTAPAPLKKVEQVVAHPVDALWDLFMLIVHFVCLVFNTICSIVIVYMLYRILTNQKTQTPTLPPLIPAEYAPQWLAVLQDAANKLHTP